MDFEWVQSQVWICQFRKSIHSVKNMKAFIYFVLLLIAGRPSVQDETSQQNKGCHGKLQKIILKDDNDLQELVKKFIDKALKVVVNNDPFQIQHLDLNYNSYGIKSKGYADQLVLASMSTTKITNIVVENGTSSLNFRFDLAMDKFKVIGAYNLDFDILTMFPIYGAGDLGLLLTGIDLRFKINLRATEDKILQMTDLDIKSSLQDSMVQVENLFNSTNLGIYISHIVSEILPRTINDGQKVFAFANLGLKSFLNGVMCDNQVTLDKIIDVMQHFIA